MKIIWLGNSSFLIKTSIGKRILIDPFNILNTFRNDIDVDIITFSKSSYTNIEKNSLLKIISSDAMIHQRKFVIYRIALPGYLSFGDDYSGLKRGKNIIYLYEIDNLKICHLGYLGHILNSELINILKNCDILFIPIGGHICLNGTVANKLCDLLNPKYIFPMCYKNNSNFYFDDPKSFLSYKRNILLLKNGVIDTSELPNESNNLVLFSSYM